MIKKVLIITGSVILLLVVVLAFAGWMNIRDRFPDYSVNIDHKSKAGPVKIGFSAVRITPEIVDTWNDLNSDGYFDEEAGETYNDDNGNGKFDAVWIAGFGNRRPANGVHDDLWARTMVLEHGDFRFALVVVDAIGFMHDDVVRVRKQISEDSDIDYCMVMNTHVHESPDLVGLWGPGDYESGVDPEYKQLVIDGAARSVDEAVARLQEASIHVGVDIDGAAGLVADTRDPQVFDYSMTTLKAISKGDSTILGTFVLWSDHPETLWDQNLLITSDFPHYLRKSLEDGYVVDDSTLIEGLGGVSVYANGAIGGLMTTHPSHPVTNSITHETFTKPSFEKAEAQGVSLAKLALKSLEEPVHVIDEADFQLKSQTIDIPMDNPLFRLGGLLGLLDRGFTGLWTVRTEVTVWKLGPITAVHVPGEIYPEIVNGGVVNPEGADFEIDPVEVPAIRDKMSGEVKMVFGLSNDLIGYIIPKSEWDQEPPYLYGADESPYGEINSLGPETAPIIHSKVIEMLKD